MQSCRLIPALLLPHADPAGAKPRRDHRFLDRVSRHVVPKTPGNDDAFKVYDPARVSHIPVSQPVRHPSGVAGSLATPDPRVVGATPLDPGLKSGHPCRGASFTTLYNELNGFCNTQMRHPWAAATSEMTDIYRESSPKRMELQSRGRKLQSQGEETPEVSGKGRKSAPDQDCCLRDFRNCGC